MFTITKADFNNILKHSCKRKYNSKVMPNIQSCLGLPKTWGNYKYILLFDVEAKHLYKPLYMNINGKRQLRAYKSNRIPKNIHIDNHKIYQITKQ